MKLRQWTLVLAAMLLWACGGGNGASTPEEAGAAMLEAVKAGDKDAILQLSASKEDLKASLDFNELPADMKEKVLQKLDEEYDEFQGEIIEEYERLVADLKAAGITASEMKLKQVDHSEKEVSGMPTSDIRIVFEAGGKAGVITAELAQLNGHWVFGPEFDLEK